MSDKMRLRIRKAKWVFSYIGYLWPRPDIRLAVNDRVYATAEVSAAVRLRDMVADNEHADCQCLNTID